MITQQIWIGEGFHPEKIDPITTSKRMINKPDGGLWTSIAEYEDNYHGQWHRFLKEEFTRSSKGIDRSKWSIYRLTIDYDMDKAYTIDSHDDLVFLVKTYPLQHDLGHIMIDQLDFEEIFRNYDLIHMTTEGQWNTRLTYPYNLYGWDTECWLWNNTANIVDIEILTKAYP